MRALRQPNKAKTSAFLNTFSRQSTNSKPTQSQFETNEEFLSSGPMPRSKLVETPTQTSGGLLSRIMRFNSQTTLDSVQSCSRMQEWRSCTELKQNSTMKVGPVKATRDAVNIEQLKRKIGLFNAATLKSKKKTNALITT